MTPTRRYPRRQCWICREALARYGGQLRNKYRRLSYGHDELKAGWDGKGAPFLTGLETGMR